MRIAAALLCCALAASAEPKGLTVVLVVDQLRPDTLARFAKEYTGGYRRVLDGARLFDGVHEHAETETGPGHSVIATGCRPASSGIVMNDWIDVATMQPVYCVGDPGSPVYGDGGQGRSPRNQLREALGDWLRKANGKSRVYSVAGKDRSAILMGGRHPDGAFWFNAAAQGFTTGAYCFPEGAPDWLSVFLRDGWMEKLPDTWTYECSPDLGPDDDPRESDKYSRTSPHPLRAANPAKFLDNLYRSPYVDLWTLHLAGEIVSRFDLGRGEAPDLLWISLSAVDSVGHLYGPASQEIRDTMLRGDRALGEFFALLDGRGVPWTLAMSADHGVLPFHLARRVRVLELAQALGVAVQQRFGREDWFRFASGHVTVNRAVAAAKGVEVAQVVAALAEAARTVPWVGATYDAAQLASIEPTTDAVLALGRKSFRADRSGDLWIVQKENVLVTTFDTGTTHGSPYAYDYEVPVAFLGPGIAPGRGGRARTIDIAPTLARRIGIPVPEGVDGTALDLGMPR